MSRHPCLFFTAAIFMGGWQSLNAEAPLLDSLYPDGGRAGETIEVKVTGKGLDKNSPQGWCSNPGVTLQPRALTGDKEKDKTLAGIWNLTIRKDAPLGPCLVRFYTNEGASPPHIFEVGGVPEMTEHEPNDSFKQVSPTGKGSFSAPGADSYTINGVLAKEGDVDTFAVPVRKDMPLDFELHGYGLGSPMDPAMHLLDEKGFEVAAAHDSHNLDPVLHFTPQKDGTLYVQVHAFVHPPQADIAFKGSPSHVYRLHIAPAKLPDASARPQPPSAHGAAMPEAPFSVQNTLTSSGQERSHAFSAKKGADLQITVRAKAIHSLLEPVLRLESLTTDGKLLKVLQTVDDASSIKEAGSLSVLDPALRWQAPADGNYRIVITDRFQSGGPRHHYHLEVKPWQPSVTASVADHALVLQPGKSANLKLTLAYDGKFPETQKLCAQALDLPPGVSCEAVKLPTKNGEVTLAFRAASDAAPAQHPVKVVIVSESPAPATAKSSEEAAARTTAAPIAVATFPIPFKELRGDLLIPTDERVWLTIPAKAAGNDKTQ